MQYERSQLLERTELDELDARMTDLTSRELHLRLALEQERRERSMLLNREEADAMDENVTCLNRQVTHLSAQVASIVAERNELISRFSGQNEEFRATIESLNAQRNEVERTLNEKLSQISNRYK
jgi:hypothetical protein